MPQAKLCEAAAPSRQSQLGAHVFQVDDLDGHLALRHSVIAAERGGGSEQGAGTQRRRWHRESGGGGRRGGSIAVLAVIRYCRQHAEDGAGSPAVHGAERPPANQVPQLVAVGRGAGRLGRHVGDRLAAAGLDGSTREGARAERPSEERPQAGSGLLDKRSRRSMGTLSGL